MKLILAFAGLVPLFDAHPEGAVLFLILVWLISRR
jgi:hypothetical protein